MENENKLIQVTPRSLINLCLDMVELDPDAEENQTMIEELSKSLGDKVENYVALNNFLKSQTQMFENEIEFLKNQMAKFDRIKVLMEERARMSLHILEKKELKSPNGHKISLRKYESVDVYDFDILPLGYRIEKVTVVPDKKAIKDAIKAGEDMPGARIVETEHVQFK